MAASGIPSDDDFSVLFSGSDDDSRENLFSSSSQDRSSVGSIPWAEDAVKQNALEWERIERMFYGEEELPEESELRNEIIDWQKAFPHLRIVGKKIEIPENVSSTSTREEVEEIIAIDPPPIPIKRRNTSTRKAFKVLERESDEASRDVTKMFAKDLRISSVPMLSRRRQMNESCSKEVPANKKPPAKRKEFLPPTVNANSVTYSSKSTAASHSSTGRYNHHHYAASAKTFRMPPISNYSMYPEKIDPDEVFKRPADVPSKQCNDHVILPTLNLEEKDYIGDNMGRSISAAYNKRIKSSFIPNSASKLKSLK